MGIIKNTVLGIVGLAVAGGATVAAVPALRNKALDFVASKSNQYQQVVDEKNELQTEKEELQVEVEAKQETLARIQTELETERTNVRNIQAQLNTANANLTQANADKASLQNQIATKNTEIENQTNRINALIETNTELQAENAELKEFKLGKYVMVTEDTEQYIEILNNGTAKLFDYVGENYTLCTYTQNENYITVEMEENGQTVEFEFEITSTTSIELLNEDAPDDMKFVYLTDELAEALETRKALKNSKINLEQQLMTQNETIYNLNESIQTLTSEKQALETRVAELETQVGETGNKNSVTVNNITDYLEFSSPNRYSNMPYGVVGQFGSVVVSDFIEDILKANYVGVHQQYSTVIKIGEESLPMNITSDYRFYDVSEEYPTLTCNKNIIFKDFDGNIVDEHTFDNLGSTSLIAYNIKNLTYEKYTKEEINELVDHFENMDEYICPLKSLTVEFEVAEFYPFWEAVDQKYSDGNRTIVINSVNIIDGTINNYYFDYNDDGEPEWVKFTGYNTIEIDGVTYTRVIEEQEPEEIEWTKITNENDLQTAIGQNITIMDNIQLTQEIVITEDTRIDLNGYTITGANIDGAVFKVSNGARLEINGDGTVSGGSGANCRTVEVLDGTVVINGGTYTVGSDADGNGNSTIYANGDNATIIINNGTFSTDADWDNFYYVLNVNNNVNAHIEVRGGTFENYNPALGDDHLGGNFVADGYEVVQDGTEYIVQPISE